MEISREISKLLLGIKAVTLNPSKPYKFVSGILSPIYCDNRLILSYPYKRNVVVNALIKLIKDNKLEFDITAGVATSGIPYAALIADRLGKPMVYVRADFKEHGKGNIVEGKIDKNRKAIVVEDLISTGKSSIAAVQSLRNAGVIVNDCIAIFTYNFKIAEKNFRANKCKLHVLSDFKTLVEVASKEGYLKKEDIKNVLEWSRNPEKWGR